MLVAGTSGLAVGVLWWRETGRRGWLSKSVPDRSGAAFTLSKRSEPSLLISPRAAQSRGVGGLWKPLLSQWVSTLSPPLTLTPPPATHPPPAPSTQLNHSQLSRARGGGGGGGGGGGRRRRGRRARGRSRGSISNKCDWFLFECTTSHSRWWEKAHTHTHMHTHTDIHTHTLTNTHTLTYTHNRPVCPPTVSCHVLWEESLPHRNRKWRSRHIHKLPCVTLGTSTHTHTHTYTHSDSGLCPPSAGAC